MTEAEVTLVMQFAISGGATLTWNVAVYSNNVGFVSIQDETSVGGIGYNPFLISSYKFYWYLKNGVATISWVMQPFQTSAWCSKEIIKGIQNGFNDIINEILVS